MAGLSRGREENKGWREGRFHKRDWIILVSLHGCTAYDGDGYLKSAKGAGLLRGGKGRDSAAAAAAGAGVRAGDGVNFLS